MKFLNYFILNILLISLLSCGKKEILLPLIHAEGIQEIYNHSSIWIFFKVEDQDTIAVLNKNNRITNTDWIFNIDKRLPMKKIIPILQNMQINRNKESMHKKEGMLNYFSYTDLSSKRISLVEFNPTNYMKSFREYKKIFGLNQVIELEIRDKKLLFNSSIIEKSQLTHEIEKLKLSSKLTKSKILLKYKDNLSFQNYLETKAILSNLGIEVDSIELSFR